MADEVLETALEDADAPDGREVDFEEALEAILFAAGHPVTYAALSRVLGLTPGKVKDQVFEYSIRYNDCGIKRGVILLCYGDSCQLCTKQEYLPEIRETLGIKKSGTLSTSSMEALAIVAYNQPVTRIFVDTLRRADSSYAMNNLIDRGLIECKGRLDVPGRPMVFGTTADFLRSFGLKDLTALPKASEELIDMFSKARDAEEEAAKDPEIEGAEQIALGDEDIPVPTPEPLVDAENEEIADPGDAETANTEAEASDGLFSDDETSAEDDLVPDDE